MSNLLKSKFLLGAMTFAVMFVGVVALKATPAAADCSITSTLRLGSKGDQVVCLQMSLGGLTADGSFGPKTKAGVIVFQRNSGLVADGVFGPKSRDVWMANQFTGNFPAGCNSAVGFSNTTGQPCFAIPSASFPPGCTSSLGFSPTTGASCATGVSTTTYPAGCASNSGFSATTGQPCSGGSVTLPAGCATASGFSSTTGQPCTTTTTTTGTNGYLADLAADSTNRVSTVYESEQDKVVAGFRATARLADMTIDRVRVTFCNDTAPGGVCVNTSATSSNLSKYISGASLWYGSTKIATMAVTDADRGTSDDIYTFNFSGIHARVPRDTVGRFYVSVNANGSLDTNDTTATWTIKFLSGGISASSPDGSFDTYPSADIEQNGLTFGKFSSSGVKSELSLSASNPTATVVPVSATAVTPDVEVLKFKIKAVNSSLTLRRIPIQITLAPQAATDDIENVINTVKLMQGSNTVDTLSGTEGVQFVAGAASNASATPCGEGNGTPDDFCTFFFGNLSSPYNVIPAGTEVEFTVRIDFKAQTNNYTTGATVTAAFANPDVLLAANYSVQDVNGDQLKTTDSTIRVGSAVGQVMTLRVNGVNVVQGAATITKITDQAGIVTSATYDIPLAVTAFGQTLYVGQAVELAAAASGASTTAKAFSFALNEAAAPAVDIVVAPTATAVTSTLSSSDATIESNAFRLDSGATKHFTMQVIVSCTAAACAGATTGNYRVHTTTVRSATDGGLTAPTNQTLIPNQSYQTLYQKIK